ncbi:uncharacterized protein LOC123721407 [Papilio machaon]|uniref:uncharacterized protein LOC123721407 n=1 Tax=Papilio machaon TaxID=76193 RepID=UPI001E664C4D|nr:uncharacterized protein LOC123721407 [Papilio machaon]
MDIEINKQWINKIHRIGVKDKAKGKPRPIIVSLVNAWKKQEILKNKKKIKSEIYITEDFPKAVLEKRRALQPQLEEEKNKGNFCFIKYDKLVVLKNNKNTEKRKRKPSTPKSNTTADNEHANLRKLSKLNAFDMLRARSNSFPQSLQNIN